MEIICDLNNHASHCGLYPAIMWGASTGHHLSHDHTRHAQPGTGQV